MNLLPERSIGVCGTSVNNPRIGRDIRHALLIHLMLFHFLLKRHSHKQTNPTRRNSPSCRLRGWRRRERRSLSYMFTVSHKVYVFCSLHELIYTPPQEAGGKGCLKRAAMLSLWQ
jgi:hypothetical protein